MAGTLKEQKEALDKGKLNIVYLNPRADRDLDVHASDTQPAFKLNSSIETLLDKTCPKADKKLVRAKGHASSGDYGHCHTNVKNAIAQHGGSMCAGWSIYEGKYCTEAEFHCCWMSPKGELFNVTRDLNGSPQDVGFVRDDATYALVTRHNQMPSNRLVWK